MEILAAAASGIAARFVTHPLDTCKTVAMSHQGSDARSLLSAAARVWRGEGIRGFYRGGGIAVLGSGPGVAAYLNTYNLANSHLSQLCDLKPLNHLAAGVIAETASCVVWVPIDVIKERMQVQHPGIDGRYRSSLDGIITCVRNESLRGLYKGYGSTIMSFGPFSAVYFATYEEAHARLSSAFPHNPSIAAFGGGAIGNMVATITTNPLEVVKTRLQIQRTKLTVAGAVVQCEQFSYKYDGVVDGLKTMARTEGIRGLWRGTGSRIAATAPNAALTMTMFNALVPKTN